MRDIPNLEPGLHAIVITVADIAQSEAIYRDLLGFPVIDQFTHTGREVTRVTHVLHVGNDRPLRLCSNDVPSQPSSWPEDNLQLGIRQLMLKVRDRNEIVARLHKADTPVLAAPSSVERFIAPGGASLEFILQPALS